MNYLKHTSGSLVLAIFLSFFVTESVRADESRWIVAGLDGGAWKSAQGDAAVKSSVQIGDAVRAAERLETFQSKQVILAKDSSGRDLIAVQGSVRFDSTEKGTRLSLERGRTLAILDGLKGREDFSISTPTGVAAVRGTRFSVDATATRMDVKTFEGDVLVSALSGGRGSALLSRSVHVLKNQRTSVEAGSKGILTATSLTPREWQRYQGDLDKVKAARKALRADGDRWFRQTSLPTRARSVPAGRSDTAVSNAAGDAIVF